MRRAVRSVAKHFPTAIVSGRCRDKVSTKASRPPIIWPDFIDDAPTTADDDGN